MKSLLLLILAILVLQSSLCFADGLSGKEKHIRAKTTVAASQEDDYDVQYVKLDIAATNTSTAITGHVTTVVKVTAATLSEYYFELSDQLTIDSATINGQPASVVSVNNFVSKIILPITLAQNAVFTADVFYHGAPTGGTNFFTNGLLHQTAQVQVTHTVSAAYHSRDWWPCKQSLTDKIDSADIYITVPAGLTVASNGLLKNVVSLSGGFNQYQWSTRNPIDYYLLSFAIAPYSEYSYYMHFSNSTDSMLIQNFIYDSATVMQQHQDELDSVAHIINYFSDLFGRYPFDNEKFGICLSPLGGGMENQTMVTLGSLDITLIAHELSHQWWGDNVTCGSLHDMWMNEGWASYCEQLFVEHFWSPQQLLNYRTNVYSQAMTAPGGSVYVDDTTNENRIYSGRLTYDKGAAVAHMLRYMINNDSLFFQVLRTYHQQHHFGTATTEDLKDIAEQITNVDLDTFFHQWVYMQGYPTYGAKWYQSGSQVVVRVSQTTSVPSSVPVFKIPIEIQLRSPQGDTIIRVPNDHNIQYYTFNWTKPMNGLAIDPTNQILNKTGAIVKDSSILNIPSVAEKKIEIFPNPAKDFWSVRNLPAPSDLVLTDINGRKVWSQHGVTDNAEIPATALPHGTYLLIISNGNHIYSYSLIR
jgi:aminopeptidase N